MRQYAYSAANIARLGLLASIVFSVTVYGQDGGTAGEKPVFRSPFELKIHIDDGKYYQQSFDHIPYVADGAVYLFAGDNFGVNATVIDDRIAAITYEPDTAKADVEFSFVQEKSPNGFVMLLVIRNRLKRKLFLDAMMTVPGKNGIYKTDVVPIGPKLTDYEAWPHPIVQLVLSSLRFSITKSQ